MTVKQSPDPQDIRAAFFDVDGTIVGFETHEVSERTRATLARLRGRGVATVLATGRPTYQLESVPLELFDAVIAFNGQLCRLADGTVVRDEPLRPADVAAIVDQCRRGLYQAMFQTRDAFFLSGRDEWVTTLEEAIDFRYPVDDPARALAETVYQVNAFMPGERDHLITDAVPGLKCLRWFPSFADVIPADGGKDVGVHLVLEHLGIDPSQAVCFGDGENDISMLDACGHAVVMGSASDEVKAHATLVTDDVAHEGVTRACERLGLV